MPGLNPPSRRPNPAAPMRYHSPSTTPKPSGARPCSSSSGSSRLPKRKSPPLRPPMAPTASGPSSSAPRPTTSEPNCSATPISPALTSPSTAGRAKKTSAPSAKTTTPSTRPSTAPRTPSPAAKPASAPILCERTGSLPPLKNLPGPAYHLFSRGELHAHQHQARRLIRSCNLTLCFLRLLGWRRLARAFLDQRPQLRNVGLPKLA